MLKTQKIILKRKPKSYPEQDRLNCGPYVLKSILDSFNLDSETNPENYLSSKLSKLNIIFPKHIKQSLENFGFCAPIIRLNKKTSKEKINELKKELKKNRPIILLVKSSYSRDKKNSQFKGHFIGHYISLWGYDDSSKVFFIYDPFIHKKHHDKIPIGNIKRSYERILKDWKVPFYLKSLSYTYIPVFRKR